MHEVTPNVVAIAVSTVMAIWIILDQTEFFIIVMF